MSWLSGQEWARCVGNVAWHRSCITRLTYCPAWPSSIPPSPPGLLRSPGASIMPRKMCDNSLPSPADISTNGNCSQERGFEARCNRHLNVTIIFLFKLKWDFSSRAPIHHLKDSQRLIQLLNWIVICIGLYLLLILMFSFLLEVKSGFRFVCEFANFSSPSSAEKHKICIKLRWHWVSEYPGRRGPD